MDWKDEASQRLRFEVLCAVADLHGKRVHEVGAGAAHLLDLLRARGIACTYSGSDRSPAMVAAARARHPGVPFTTADVAAGLDGGPWDVVLCSGVFHVKLAASDAAWQAFVHAALRHMWAACREAMAFNLVSDQVDYRTPGLWYAPAAQVLDFCRHELSRRVVLRHDYPLHEYTVYVYRTPP
jgi:SAM-dependent methyltransferase